MERARAKRAAQELLEEQMRSEQLDAALMALDTEVKELRKECDETRAERDKLRTIANEAAISNADTNERFEEVGKRARILIGKVINYDKMF